MRGGKEWGRGVEEWEEEWGSGGEIEKSGEESKQKGGHKE